MKKLMACLFIAFVVLILSTAFAEEDAQNCFEEAQKALWSGNTEEALKLFEKCAEQGIRPHDAYFEMGLIYYREGEYLKAFRISKKAIRAFRMHLKAHPEDHQSWFRLAYIYELRSEAPSISEWEKAREALEEALKRSENNSLYLLHLGYVCYKIGDVEKAKEAFEGVVAMQPSNAYARYYLALLDLKAGNIEQAKAAFSWIVENLPESSPLYQGAKKELTRLEEEKDEG
jgi:tetratricopeptide (TPR) repeat protein